MTQPSCVDVRSAPVMTQEGNARFLWNGAVLPTDEHIPVSPRSWLPQAGGLAGLSDCHNPSVGLWR